MRTMTLLVAGWVMASLTMAQDVEPKSESKPLPARIVKAWEEAGADVVWIALSNVGYLQFHGGKDLAGWDGPPVPAFRFKDWPAKGLEGLPVPAQPFGLCLFDTEMGDKGLATLARLKAVSLLRLDGTKVTDEGLKHLAGLGGLTGLDLSGTQVTDRGLARLAGLKKLSSLRLADTMVTDEGLRQLSGLKSLRWLELRDTKVTDAGVKKLQKALPKCEIDR